MGLTRIQLIDTLSEMNCLCVRKSQSHPGHSFMMNGEVRLKSCSENEKERELVSSFYHDVNIYTETKTHKERCNLKFDIWQPCKKK